MTSYNYKVIGRYTNKIRQDELIKIGFTLENINFSKTKKEGLCPDMCCFSSMCDTGVIHDCQPFTYIGNPKAIPTDMTTILDLLDMAAVHD